MAALSIHALQVAGGLSCVVATMLAWWVSWAYLAHDRTHFISEVLALPWWHGTTQGKRAFWCSVIASVLLAGGAISFGLAAVIELGTRWTASSTGAAATGALLLAIVVFPLREVAPDQVAVVRGLDLAHPFFAALFYVVAMVAAGIAALDHAGPVGVVLAALHIASSIILSAAVLALAPRAVGPAAWQPFYLPGVRILLDRRRDTPAELVRRLQWPATVLVALDLGLTPLGF